MDEYLRDESVRPHRIEDEDLRERTIIQQLEDDAFGPPEAAVFFEGDRHAAAVAQLRSARRSQHRQKWIIRGLLVGLVLALTVGCASPHSPRANRGALEVYGGGLSMTGSGDAEFDDLGTVPVLGLSLLIQEPDASPGDPDAGVMGEVFFTYTGVEQDDFEGGGTLGTFDLDGELYQAGLGLRFPLRTTFLGMDTFLGVGVALGVLSGTGTTGNQSEDFDESVVGGYAQLGVRRDVGPRTSLNLTYRYTFYEDVSFGDGDDVDPSNGAVLIGIQWSL